MKYYILLFLAFLLLAGGCVRSVVEDIDKDLAVFVGTRADAPLEGTVWECRTGEKFNRYLLFQDGEVSLFYGLVEDGTVQRWSDFYTASYALQDGAIVTSLTFPLWGEKKATQTASVVKAAGAYAIALDGEMYYLCEADASDLDAVWMTLYVPITPWEY